MDYPRATIVLSLCIAGLCCAIWFGLPAVMTWERNAGYPYGMACDSVLTLYVDRCKKPL